MGVCCSSTSNTSKKKKRLLKDSASIISILRKGNLKELTDLVMNYPYDINAYSFDSNKTLLITAILECPNASIVKMIIDRGGDVNLIEKETGNPPLFIAAVDLKINYVNELLLGQVDLKKRNLAQQNIYEFLQFELFVQRKELKMEQLNVDEKSRYDSIVKWIQMAERGNGGNGKGNNDSNNNNGKGSNNYNPLDNPFSYEYYKQQKQLEEQKQQHKEKENTEKLDNDYVPRVGDDESEGFN